MQAGSTVMLHYTGVVPITAQYPSELIKTLQKEINGCLGLTINFSSNPVLFTRVLINEGISQVRLSENLFL